MAVVRALMGLKHEVDLSWQVGGDKATTKGHISTLLNTQPLRGSGAHVWYRHYRRWPACPAPQSMRTLTPPPQPQPHLPPAPLQAKREAISAIADSALASFVLINVAIKR